MRILNLGLNSREARMSLAPKTIAVVAHDNKKDELLDWCREHRSKLEPHLLVATGTTGRLLRERLNLEVETVMSGPLGGDQQIGARIAEGSVELLIFFWDPLEAQPHDPDVRALLRLAVVWNIPVATNSASATFIIESPLMAKALPPRVSYDDHVNRLYQDLDLSSGE